MLPHEIPVYRPKNDDELLAVPGVRETGTILIPQGLVDSRSNPKTDDELRAMVSCMRRHDDSVTQDRSTNARAIVVLPGVTQYSGSTALMEPDTRCVAHEAEDITMLRSAETARAEHATTTVPQGV